jgi:hypothetical protein
MPTLRELSHDRHSTTRFCIFFGDSLIYWKSKRQQRVALSTTEPEYCAMTQVTRDITSLRWLLQDMGVVVEKSSTLYCDNQRVIHIAKNLEFHERTKHIEIDFSFHQ